MKENLKKYGFIILVAIFFLGIAVFYVVESNKDKVPGKTVDGKDLVFSIGENNFTADDLYDTAYKNLGIRAIYQLFEKEVITKTVEVTDEMKKEASLGAENIILSYKSQFGADYKEQIGNELKKYGYRGFEDLENFITFNLQANELLKSYFESHADTIIDPYIEEYKPRLLSHILVSMADPENPTEEELQKMADVDAALANGDDFSTVAAQFSDDGSAANGGNLGFCTKDTSFVPEFLEASLQLEEGQRSEWVKTQYGMHLIVNNASTYEKLKEEATDDFYSALSQANTDAAATALWESGEALGLEFADEAIKTELRKYMGLEAAQS